MNNKKENIAFVGGVVGTIVTLLCCATPLLIVLLGAIGLGELATWNLDFILIPMLVLFLGLTYFSYQKLSNNTGGSYNE